MRVRLLLGVWKEPAIGAASRLGVGVGTLIIVGALLLVIVFLPQLAVDQHGLGRTDWLKAVQDLPTTILQGLGGLALLGTLYFSARTLRLNRRGQLTERFTKAVEQLSQPVPEQLAVRLGGIYALEQIALDSEELHWPVMEVLSACLRESSRTADLGAEPQVTTDLQAIATVLGRRPEARRRQEGDRRLDLGKVRLPQVDLGSAKLQRAILDRAELQGADLKGARLQGAGPRWRPTPGRRLHRRPVARCLSHRCSFGGRHVPRCTAAGGLPRRCLPGESHPPPRRFDGRKRLDS